MPIPIVSFYSDVDGSDYYSRCGRRLVAQCESLGVEHHVVERRYGGDWCVASRHPAVCDAAR